MQNVRLAQLKPQLVLCFNTLLPPLYLMLCTSPLYSMSSHPPPPPYSMFSCSPLPLDTKFSCLPLHSIVYVFMPSYPIYFKVLFLPPPYVFYIFVPPT